MKAYKFFFIIFGSLLFQNLGCGEPPKLASPEVKPTTPAQPLKVTPLGNTGFSVELAAQKLGITWGLWGYSRLRGKEFAAYEKNTKGLAELLSLDPAALKEFPASKGDPSRDEAATIHHFIGRGQPGREVATTLGAKYSKQIAAWFEFGLKSVLALSLHIENEKDGVNTGFTEALRRGAETIGLPDSIGSPFLTALEQANVSQKEAAKLYAEMNLAVETLLKLPDKK